MFKEFSNKAINYWNIQIKILPKQSLKWNKYKGVDGKSKVYWKLTKF